MLYAADRDAGAALAGKFPKLVQPSPRRSADGTITIVRPDAYTGFTGTADAWDAAETYLADLVA